MCGIVGRAGSSQPLDAAMATLGHRGPDGSGQFVADGVALGHTRLSIIDLEGGAQPLQSACRRWTLIANGEIYNHLELRAELETAGVVFATGSDCEVILHGYRIWGRAVLNRIEGMYAFALHDAEADEVLLARDPLGMKPLFIREDVGGVSFASEIKALLALDTQPVEVAGQAVVQYLECQHSLGRATPIRGIERVLAGEAVLVRSGKVCERWRHWNVSAIADRREDDPVRALDALMEQVFTQHQRSDVPIGLFLSGGVDSTILLALMRRYGMSDIHTLSIGFPNSSVGDESAVATSLAKHFGTHHRVITPEPDTVLGKFVHTIWAADDLMRDPANLPTALLAEAAGETMKVVFSGEGGDESFAGYGRYRTGAVERALKSLFFPGTGGFRAQGDLRGGLAGRLLRPEWLAARQGWRKPLIDSWRSYPTHWSDLQRMQALDLEHALPNNLLVKADRMLMAHGVEGRMPFVDRRVVEFGLMLEDHLKRDRRTGKKILRAWASGFMPSDHFAAKKRGFFVPVNDWWRGDRLQALGTVLTGNEAIRRWFRPEGVESVLAEQQRVGRSGRLLMNLLQFAIWHRLFIESPGAPPPVAVDPLEFLAQTG